MTPVSSNSPRRVAPLAALWTPRGRGAVATIRVVGDRDLWHRASARLFRATHEKLPSDLSLERVAFGRWGAEPAEDVVVCRCDEHVVEIHCHGGDAASRRILADLEATGYWVVTSIDMLAATAGRLQAECNDALARATTFRTAAILLEQQSGILHQAVERLLEAQDQRALSAGLKALLDWAEFGLHLTQPWQVVLAGRPNVGKSSLINALVGYSRSIVFSEPGTTRDVVTAETAFDGWPVRLADTAGIRNNADALEAAGMERARQMLEQADGRLILLDTSRPVHAEDLRLLADWPAALVVAHKCDLPDVWGDQLPAGAVRVSSLSGAGVDELMRAIVAWLVPRVPPAGTQIPVSPRQVELLLRAEKDMERGDGAGAHEALRECLGVPDSWKSPGKNSTFQCA